MFFLYLILEKKLIVILEILKELRKKLNNKIDTLNKEHRISLNFKIIYSSTFDHSIDYFKMDDYFSEVK